MQTNGNYFRQRRMEHFLEIVDRIAITDRPLRILDIGGTRQYWEALEPLWSVKNLSITIVNLGIPAVDDGCFHMRPGNACALNEYASNSFDIVHSNSVIEHVGQWQEMVAMAREVRRLAPHYFVQTPNLWFPLEPHYRSLFFAWYTQSSRARMLMRKQHGFRGPYATFGEALLDVQTVNLLDATGMAELFPDGQLVRERVFGLTKSLTVTR